MKLIIDIDEDYYKAICKRAERFGRGSAILPPSERIIFNGTSLSEELEKTKGKVIACFNQEDNVFSSNFNLGIEMAISVIDKSIFELKGENNETNN